MQSAAQGHGQAVWHCWMWQGGLWGGLSDPINFTNLCRALALPSGKIRKAVLGKQGREERGTGPRETMSGVGKARGVIDQEWWQPWHCWPCGGGRRGSRCLLATGELCQDESPGGELGCVCSRSEVAPITDGSFLFFFQMSPGTECLGRTFPGKLGK